MHADVAETTYHMEGLTPYTTYYISVAARTSAGTGVYSTEIRQRTAENGKGLHIASWDLQKVVCVSSTVRMRFNFCGVYISRICNFCGFRVFKFAGAGYSGVEIFAGEIFVDVFRHVVLVPVGVPMLAQAVFPRVYHPLFFFGWPGQRNMSSSTLSLCSPSTLSLALSLNDARLLQCHFQRHTWRSWPGSL